MSGFDVSKHHRIADGEADASGHLAFSSRGEYIAWTRKWKAELASTAASIREAKACRRDRSKPDYERGWANAERQSLRVAAFNLFALRAAGRRRAAAQYAAASQPRRDLRPRGAMCPGVFPMPVTLPVEVSRDLASERASCGCLAAWPQARCRMRSVAAALDRSFRPATKVVVGYPARTILRRPPCARSGDQSCCTNCGMQPGVACPPDRPCRLPPGFRDAYPDEVPSCTNPFPARMPFGVRGGRSGRCRQPSPQARRRCRARRRSRPGGPPPSPQAEGQPPQSP